MISRPTFPRLTFPPPPPTFRANSIRLPSEIPSHSARGANVDWAGSVVFFPNPLPTSGSAFASIPSTFNPTPSTLNPQPDPLNPPPATHYPQSSTINPHPSALSPVV